MTTETRVGNTAEVATSFVDLVLRFDRRLVKEISGDEVRILFDTVSAAGFELRELIP